MDSEDYGSLVKNLRQKTGLTQSQVAESLGVTPGYISNVENNRTAMSLRILTYYARLVGCSLDSLVGDLEPEYAETALDSAGVQESLLQNAGLAVVADAFHGDDVGTFGLAGQHAAAGHGLAVEDNGAGAALAFAAAFLDAEHTQIVMEQVQQALIGGRLDGDGLAVQSKVNGNVLHIPAPPYSPSSAMASSNRCS